MRLIDADALRKDVLALPNCYNGFSDAYDKSLIIGIIDEQIVVDAVPVVRCKDCRYAHMSTDGRVKYCEVWFPDEAEYLDGDDYCSYGERRNDDAGRV